MTGDASPRTFSAGIAELGEGFWFMAPTSTAAPSQLPAPWSRALPADSTARVARSSAALTATAPLAGRPSSTCAGSAKESAAATARVPSAEATAWAAVSATVPRRGALLRFAAAAAGAAGAAAGAAAVTAAAATAATAADLEE